MAFMSFGHPLALLLLLPAALFVVLAARALRRSAREAAGAAATGRRRLAALIARTVTLVLIVLALAGASLALVERRVNVIFAVDGSSSIDDPSRAHALSDVRELARGAKAGDATGVIAFSGEASMVAPPAAGAPLPLGAGSISSPQPDATDIAQAIRFAIASFPEKGQKRLVLLSDGRETQGDAEAAAVEARAAGVPIVVVPLLPPPPREEVYISSLTAPPTVEAGRRHNLTVTIRSRSQTSAQLTFLKDGAYLGEERVDLEAGDNTFTYASVLDRPGVHSYEVVIQPAEDTIPDNNSAETLVRVIGKPALLYVAPDGRATQSLVDALRVQGFEVDRVDAAAIPDTLSDLVRFDAIIFDNVPAFDLSLQKMSLISRFVRDTGGGFLMIGGDSSFGVGGYYQTPIESVLPVDVDTTSTMKVPSVSIVMVIDKSGSMGDKVGDGSQTKLDLVKQAVLAAADVLNPFSTIGILSFDAQASWTLPLTQAGQRKAIEERLSTLNAGGGTVLYPALAEAYRRLRTDPAAIRHIIVLTDGQTDAADFEGLVREIAADRITVSTVAVGHDADRALLERIASLGKGRAYYTDDPRTIPRIFASESIIVSRGLISRGAFLPVVSSPSPLLAGIPRDLPPISGFVLTYLKPGAQMVLEAAAGNPLLATWRYGLGRTIAFTSDLGRQWGVDWADWSSYPRFVAQMIRTIERPASSGLLHATLTHDRGTGTLSIDAIDSSNRFVNFLDLRGVLSIPGGEVREFRIPQVGPGLYVYRFPAGKSGQYLATVYGTNGSEQVAPETYGMAISYSEEFVPLGPDVAVLQAIARESGGLYAAPGSSIADGRIAPPADAAPAQPGEAPAKPYDLYAPSAQGERTTVNLALPLAALALLLLLVELAVRYLRVGRVAVPGAALTSGAAGAADAGGAPRAAPRAAESPAPARAASAPAQRAAAGAESTQGAGAAASSYAELASLIERRRKEEILLEVTGPSPWEQVDLSALSFPKRKKR